MGTFNKTYSSWVLSGNGYNGYSELRFTPILTVNYRTSGATSSLSFTMSFKVENIGSVRATCNFYRVDGTTSAITVNGQTFTFSGTYYSSSEAVEAGETTYLTVSGSTSGIKHKFSDGTGSVVFSGDLTPRLGGVQGGQTFYLNETVALDVLNLSGEIVSATNFTDEQNPSMTYLIVPAASGSGGALYTDYPSYNVETVTVEAAISIDGVNAAVPYRQIPNSGSSYTFSLTDEERVALISSVIGTNTSPVYYLIRTTRTLSYNHSTTQYTQRVLHTQAQRVFTIVSEAPSMIVDVVDVNPVTIALTGSNDKFIKYHSNGAFTIEATPGKGAEITRVEASNGSQTVSGTSGTINGIESNTFNFYAVDSRAMASATAMVVDFVDYVKLTCRQQIEMELEGETGAIAHLTILGNYYNGSFGIQNNELAFEIRHTQNDGTMGEWTPLLATFEQDGHSYKKTVTISGLRYDVAYTFQCRVTDKLETATTPEYVARVMPVFDWSEDDFNFNVPVNINSTLSWQGGSIEAGSWTPECLEEGAISSYTTQVGWYQKMGNVVTVGFMLAGVCGNGFTSTGIEIGGLPYYPVNTGFGGGVCSQARVNAGFNFQCWAATTNGTITARVQACNNTSAGNLSTSGSGLFYSASGTSITLGGTITYLTD